jgi:hypothetical protein
MMELVFTLEVAQALVPVETSTLAVSRFVPAFASEVV